MIDLILRARLGQTWRRLQQQPLLRSHLLLTVVATSGAVALLRLTGLLQPWEWVIFDYTMRLRPLEARDERIVIVGIDETTVRQINWPLSDQALTTLLQRIQAARPRVIGLDVYRDLPVGVGGTQLGQIFDQAPNLIGIRRLKDQANPGVAAPPILALKQQVGFNNLVVDLDGKVRRSLLYWKDTQGKRHQSFALKVALQYLSPLGIEPMPAAHDPRAMQLGHATIQWLHPHTGAYVGADTGGNQVLANLRGPAGHIHWVSALDVLAGRVAAKQFRDRIVLIGSTAVSLNDVLHTAYSVDHWGGRSPQPMSGVELEANFISQLISAALDRRSILQPVSEPMEWGWILVWAWLGAGVGMRSRSLRNWLINVGMASGLLTGSVYGALLLGWWLPWVPSIMTLMGATIALTVQQSYQEEGLKRSIEFLQSIIHSIPDPVFVKDANHRFVVINSAYCRLVGKPMEAVLGQSVHDLWEPAQADLIYQQDVEVLRQGCDQEDEAALTDTNGQTYLVATKRSLHRDATGNVFLIGVMHDITQRKQVEQELTRRAEDLLKSNEALKCSASQLMHWAHHDSLTGLPNRKAFEANLVMAIARAAEHHQTVGVLFLDLDGFKPINDTLGHAVGDQVLQAVAMRLTNCLRKSDQVCRLGGDEFTVILPIVTHPQKAAVVAQKILAHLAQPFAFGEHTVTVTTSIGIGFYPDHGSDAATVVQMADQAMYAAKSLGKNQFVMANQLVLAPNPVLSGRS